MFSKVERADFMVQSAEVADLLRNPLEVQRLLHFLQPQGSTVSAFSRATGLSENAAFRKVKRYEHLGLLELLRQQQRSGRAVKVYYCPYRSFFIGQQWVPLEQQIGEVFEPLRNLMIHSMTRASSEGVNPVGGMILTVTPEGVWMLPATEKGERWQPQLPGTPAYLHDCGPLFLNYEDAKALQRELYELFDRYRALRGSNTYLLHQFLTPAQIQPNSFALPNAGYTNLI